MSTDPLAGPAFDLSRGAVASTTRPRSFAFTGDGSTFFGLTMLNVILNFVTLGIWFGWGRVRELRYLIGETRVEGDPLSFHGRGGELLRGVLIAFFAFLLPMYVLFFLAGRPGSTDAFAYLIFANLLLFLLVGFASVGSIRYRLPRTEWRGIRFGFDGRVGEFLAGYVARMLMVIVTLGLTYPFYSVWRRRWMMEHSRFGTVRFAIELKESDLYPRFLVCWLLGPFTLGFSWVWYMGFQQAYFWNRTSLAGARFRTSMTGFGWLGLQFQNALLAFFTFGLGGPWVVVRMHRWFFQHLYLDGALDLAAIRQDRQRTSGVGEGTLDVLDLDSGLDLG